MQANFCTLILAVFVTMSLQPPGQGHKTKKVHKATAMSVASDGEGSNPTLAERMAHGERWPVKVGGDADVASVSGLASPLQTTVHALINEPFPSQLKLHANAPTPYRTHRVGPMELTTCQIDADIVEIRFESDHDFHVVIRDHNSISSETMIVECPEPDLVPPTSPWRAAISSARGKLQARFHLTSGVLTVNPPVHAMVTGVAMFDFIHPIPQSGVAPNAIELHPIIGINF